MRRAVGSESETRLDLELGDEGDRRLVLYTRKNALVVDFCARSAEVDCVRCQLDYCSLALP